MNPFPLVLLGVVLACGVSSWLAVIESTRITHSKRARWSVLAPQVLSDYGIVIDMTQATGDTGSTLDGERTYSLAVGDGRILQVREGETHARLILPEWVTAQ